MNFYYKTIPLHTSEKVPLDQEIEVFFMVDVIKASLSEESVILFNINEQKVEPVGISYHNRVLKINPEEKLKPMSHYQLQLIGGSKGIKDIVGRVMPQTAEVEFHTKDVDSIKPPRILSPTDLSVTRNRQTFRLDPQERADRYDLQISRSNTFQNLVWPVNNQQVFNDLTIDVTPDFEYETGQYFVRARSISEDDIVSAWSPSLRFYYDNEPIIEEEPEEEHPNEEPAPDPDPEPDPEPSVPLEPLVPATPTTGPLTPLVPATPVVPVDPDIVLVANGKAGAGPSELDALENMFSPPPIETKEFFSVKGVLPKNRSVNNKLESVNQIIIDFTEEIDPSSVDTSTCYVLVERN